MGLLVFFLQQLLNGFEELFFAQRLEQKSVGAGQTGALFRKQDGEKEDGDAADNGVLFEFPTDLKAVWARVR
jgi:hypothetical protein